MAPQGALRYAPGQGGEWSHTTNESRDVRKAVQAFGKCVFDLAQTKAKEDTELSIEECIQIHLDWLQTKQAQGSKITHEDITGPNTKHTTSQAKSKKARTTHHVTHIQTGISISANSEKEARQKLPRELTRHLKAFANLARIGVESPIERIAQVTAELIASAQLADEDSW